MGLPIKAVTFIVHIVFQWHDKSCDVNMALNKPDYGIDNIVLAKNPL